MPPKSLVAALTSLPYQEDVITHGIDARNNVISRVTRPWEGFFRQIGANTNSLIQRQNPSQLLNSNFNILSANSTLPVTPAQGSNYELVKQWYLVNGGGTNNYTITPTAYTNVASGLSNYYLNVQIPTQDSPLYLYNLNYSLTSQFNSIAAINQQPVTFSWSIINNLSNVAGMQFSVALSTGAEYLSKFIYLTQGRGPNGDNSLTLDPIDLTGDAYSPSDIAQFRVYFSQVSNSPIDLNVAYIKAELSEMPSPLEINPVLESYLCTNLT